jgi:flagellar assembly factor FliW
MMTAMAPTMTAGANAPLRDVQTILGPLQVRDAHVLRFADGLLGFPECREWIVLESRRPGTAWLQSLDRAPLAFLLLDPFTAFDGFAVDVPAGALRALRATPSDAVAVLAPVALPAAPGAPATANLKGLVLINWNARTGVQCVIDSGPWSVREPVPGGLEA